jgi:hypothetical protein
VQDKVLAELESLEGKLSLLTRERDDALVAAAESRAQQLVAARERSEAQAALVRVPVSIPF